MLQQQTVQRRAWLYVKFNLIKLRDAIIRFVTDLIKNIIKNNNIRFTYLLTYLNRPAHTV